MGVLGFRALGVGFSSLWDWFSGSEQVSVVFPHSPCILMV